MARFLKEAEIPGADNAARLPAGSTALRPEFPLDGQIRWNTDTNYVEVYWSGTWNNLARVGVTNIVKDSFVGDGSTSTFEMSVAETSDTAVLVFIGNVHQNPTVAYSVSGLDLTFGEAPPAGMDIVVLHGFNSTNAI